MAHRWYERHTAESNCLDLIRSPTHSPSFPNETKRETPKLELVFQHLQPQGQYSKAWFPHETKRKTPKLEQEFQHLQPEAQNSKAWFPQGISDRHMKTRFRTRWGSPPVGSRFRDGSPAAAQRPTSSASSGSYAAAASRRRHEQRLAERR